MRPSPAPPSVSVAEIKNELREILDSQTFRQAPKLSRLLSYVCNKALLEEADQVTEYTIGVDVFGKPENFKESKDSNVRVELHRLRKRLAQFYEGEGADRALRMVIPPGHYTPEFIVEGRRTGALAAADPEDVPAVEESAGPELPPSVAESSPVPPPEVALPAPAFPIPASPPAVALPSRPGWGLGHYGLVLVAAAAVMAGILLIQRAWFPFAPRKDPPAPGASSSQPTLSFPAPVAGTAGASVPLRIMAGYTGPSQTDGSGFVWGPDQYFEGGRPALRTDTRTARTNIPFLYQYSRIGDFSYAIPLPPGVYELHLFFIESEYGPEYGNGENERTMFLHINDRRLVPELDIESDAMGQNIADERVFRNIRPAADGKLHISLESAKGVPMLNAIEVVPGIPHRQQPIRIVTQPVPFTGHDGVKWQPDNYYMNGRSVPRNLGVTGTPDPGLFTMERYGHFSYSIPVDTEGRYALTLHFAELYFGSSASPSTGVGSRVFNVMCNGTMLLDHLDIFREVGTARALSKTFHNLKPTAQGKLNITFEPVVNYALVSGIEVVEEP